MLYCWGSTCKILIQQNIGLKANVWPFQREWSIKKWPCNHIVAVRLTSEYVQQNGCPLPIIMKNLKSGLGSNITILCLQHFMVWTSLTHTMLSQNWIWMFSPITGIFPSWFYRYHAPQASMDAPVALLGILSRNVPNVGALMTPNEAVAENIWLARVTCVQEKLVGAIDSIGVVYKQKCLSPQTSRSAKEGFRCRNPTNHYNLHF